MPTPLQTNQFTTTDGFHIHIFEYGTHSNYKITDQQNNKYFATARNNISILYLEFKYDKMENDGYTVYSDEQRKTKHLGNILASKRFNNPQEIERAIINAVRKIAELTPMFIIALNEIENIGFVIIDGIADLATAINDEDEATRVIGLLLKWTKIHNIHICNIIHENKNNNFATGHLGSSIMKKSETVAFVTRDDKLTKVTPDYCRNYPFDEFYFELDENHLPKESEENQPFI